MFFTIEKSEERTSEFSQNSATIASVFLLHMIFETRKIANLLGDEGNESLKFATRKWYVINDQNKTDYGEENENGTTIKFETQVIKSNLLIIQTHIDITETGGNANAIVAFKGCAPFTKCVTHINDKDVDDAESLDILMPMYNLIEYIDNYSDTSGTLWQFKRYELPVTAAWNPDNVSVNNSPSFKYKSSFFKPLEATNNGVFRDVKIAVPLKYLSNFGRSLEMLLINCKIHLELSWCKGCVMSTIAEIIFKITNTKLYVPIVSLSSKGNAKLVKRLGEGFNRLV